MGQQVIRDNCDFGWVAAWASEMGDEATLRGLLAHADRFMNPTWRDGGLYYPRHDTTYDTDGQFVEMEPLSGNVLLGYARLNVPDGIWGLFNRPFERAHFDEPALTAVDRDVDVTQAEAVDGELRTRLCRAREVPGEGTVTIGRVVGRGRWTVAVDGQVVARIDGTTAQFEPDPGPWGDALQISGDEVILRCTHDPHTFTFRQDR